MHAGSGPVLATHHEASPVQVGGNPLAAHVLALVAVQVQIEDLAHHLGLYRVDL
jgi:hypothetical protein